jgi:hypothetical protein
MTVDKSIPLDVASQGETTTLNVPTLRTTINTTSNWTVPAGVKAILLVAAGGGGGSGQNMAGTGSSGGGGGGVAVKALPVTPGSTVGITIGAGGTANAYNASNSAKGNTGGTTQVNISTLSIRANGGTGGGGNTNTATARAQTGNGGNAIIYSNVSGSLSSIPSIKTNFVLDIPHPYVTANSASYYWSSSGGWSQQGNYSAPGYSSILDADLQPSCLGILKSYIGTNNTPYPIFDKSPTYYLAGSSGGAGNASWNSNSGTQPQYFISSVFGQTGFTGGGGAANPELSATQYLQGYGGGGIGGAGGNTNAAGTLGCGGGGGGIAGAGNSATSNAAGNGGAGGGGGGGKITNSTGGTGGDGAVLIYY